VGEIMTTTSIEIELPDDVYNILLDMAHKEDITFNHLCERALMMHIIRDLEDENERLKAGDSPDDAKDQSS
jgi:hypothetical protein